MKQSRFSEPFLCHYCPLSPSIFICSPLLHFLRQGLKSHLHWGFKIQETYRVQWYLSRGWKSILWMMKVKWIFDHGISGIKSWGRGIEREIVQALEFIPSWQLLTLLVHELCTVPLLRLLSEGLRVLCCCCSISQSCLTLCDPMDCSMPGFPVLHHLPGLTQTHVHWVGMPSNHLVFCRSLLLLPSVFPNIRVFSNESVLHIRWPKYYSFSFSISPFNEYSGLISFRISWLDLLAVQGNLKSLLQHHSSKTSILSHWASLWSNSHILTWLLEKP